MELITGATFIVAVQLSLVAGLNLFHRKVANRLLGALFLVFLLSVKYFLFSYMNSEGLIHLFERVSSSQFYGPVFYLFLLAVAKKLESKHWWYHLAFPVVLGLLYAADDQWQVLSDLVFLRTYILVEYGLIWFYFLLSWRFFRHGNLDHIKVKKRYRIFFIIVFADLIYNFGELALSIYMPDFHASLMPGLFQLDMLIYLSIFLYLVLFGLTELNWVRKLFVPKTIYLAHGHNQETEIATKLKELFEKEELYLDPDLTLEKLAKAAEVNRTVLSEYLTVKRGTSFKDLVNQYRIQAFKERVGDPQYAHLDIIGIAYAAGFGSKATFYRVFKQAEGMTPSAYRKQFKH